MARSGAGSAHVGSAARGPGRCVTLEESLGVRRARGRVMRNAVATSALVAALLLGAAACGEGAEQQRPERSPSGTATSVPPSREPSASVSEKTATGATREATQNATPTRTVAPAPTPTGAPASATPRWTPSRTPSAPASTPTVREGSRSFTPGSEQSTLDDWRRGQCEDAGYTNCE